MQPTPQNPPRLLTEFWGGTAAMLVAFPSAIAFGVTVFLPFGAQHSAHGAMAGMIAAVVLGLVAPILGRTGALISAPCAPAAAVLTAFAIQSLSSQTPPETAIAMIAVLVLMCGAIQVIFGLARLGRLIGFTPYPVTAGYMSAIGLLIILSQVPGLLGAPKDMALLRMLVWPSLWNTSALPVGLVTIAVMVVAPRVTRRVPAAILALAAGVITYRLMGVANRSLLTLWENPLVVGRVGGTGGSGFALAATDQWKALWSLHLIQISSLLAPAFMLAVLLSIDTLKTSLIVDNITRARHDHNRELISHGLANMASTLVGGLPGSAPVGPTIVNVATGARTRFSSAVEGALSLVAVLLLGRFIAWIPIACLAGILMVVGFRMIDRNCLHLARSRATVFDFAVIVVVVVAAVIAGIIVAAGLGIALAILLFLREQIRISVVRRKSYGDATFSKQARLPEEMEALVRRGQATVIFELQGSLFFGTTDKLYTDIEPELRQRKYLVLDMRRVQAADITAVQMMERLADMLGERGSTLIFTDLPRRLPSGRNLEAYFDEVGLLRSRPETIRVFSKRSDALEWVENRLLEDERLCRNSELPLDLAEIALFRDRKPETIAALRSCVETRCYRAGERIFAAGDATDDLFLVRRGQIRILLPLAPDNTHHLATFSRGDFFGEMAFLDRERRSADAVAFADSEVYVLSRARFDEIAKEHRVLAATVLDALARALAVRLRHTTGELRALQDA